MTWTIHHAEVLDALAGMPDASVDAALLDPPYGLGAHQPTVEELIAYLSGADLDTGGDFMGRDWCVPSVRVWRELFRVLKPGAHVLAFGGSRTGDLITIGLRAAGFEIRDQLQYLYASGFPKSLAADKAMDAANGDERPVVGSGENWGASKAADGKNGLGDFAGAWDVTSAASAVWEGYGTALKPAFEPIVLARKPLCGTLAENIAKWGVGAIAIGACRIEAHGRPRIVKTGATWDGSSFASAESRAVGTTDVGRWPANVLLDEGAGEVLDAQAGERKSGIAVTRNGGGGRVFAGISGSGLNGYADAPRPDSGYSDSGGASRFFFTAKPSREERERGCSDLPFVSAADMTDSEEGQARLDSPRTGAGRTSGARNSHPTLKPVSLTRYLATMLLPPPRENSPRRILVPYAGSGSEMIGGVLAGWDDVVGVEREPRTPESPDYIAILKARVGLAATNPRAFEPYAVRSAAKVDERQVSLFGGVK